MVELRCWRVAEPVCPYGDESLHRSEAVREDLGSDRPRAGRPISHFDAQSAAIARFTGAAIATRNVADFDGCGVTLVDPWKA